MYLHRGLVLFPARQPASKNVLCLPCSLYAPCCNPLAGCQIARCRHPIWPSERDYLPTYKGHPLYLWSSTSSFTARVPNGRFVLSQHSVRNNRYLEMTSHSSAYITSAMRFIHDYVAIDTPLNFPIRYPIVYQAFEALLIEAKAEHVKEDFKRLVKEQKGSAPRFDQWKEFLYNEWIRIHPEWYATGLRQHAPKKKRCWAPRLSCIGGDPSGLVWEIEAMVLCLRGVSVRGVKWYKWLLYELYSSDWFASESLRWARGIAFQQV